MCNVVWNASPDGSADPGDWRPGSPAYPAAAGGRHPRHSRGCLPARLPGGLGLHPGRRPVSCMRVNYQSFGAANRRGHCSPGGFCNGPVATEDHRKTEAPVEAERRPRKFPRATACAAAVSSRRARHGQRGCCASRGSSRLVNRDWGRRAVVVRSIAAQAPGLVDQGRLPTRGRSPQTTLARARREPLLMKPRPARTPHDWRYAQVFTGRSRVGGIFETILSAYTAAACCRSGCEMHPTFNQDLEPATLGAGSSRKVWWCCGTCGHEWPARVASRTAGDGCPECARRHQRERGPRPVPNERSLATNCPELLAELYPTRNLHLDPDKLGASSNAKVWWCCATCDHEWQAKVGNRSRGSGCPACARAGNQPSK